MAAVKAHERVGNYWHMLPEAAQARKAIWDAVNPHTGKKRIDEAFPLEIRAFTRDHEMLIGLKCGSTWQVVGSDNYDSLVGAAPIGIVFSEFALAKPQAWAYLRPILAENGGWALFIYTSRGNNHGKTFFEEHKDDPDWFVQKLEATQTDVFTPEQLAQELREYIREYGEAQGRALFRQEYHCDFDSPVLGAVYSGELAKCQEEGRVCRLLYDRKHPVQTFWDIGVTTAVWFVQPVQTEIRLIDYFESYGDDVPAYAKMLRDRDYIYGRHVLPWDAETKIQGTGKSFEEMMLAQGFRCEVAPQLPFDDGVKQVRTLFPRMLFEEKKTADGRDALMNYHYRFNKSSNELTEEPVHDWASHGSDALRTMAVSLKEMRRRPSEDRESPGSWMAA